MEVQLCQESMLDMGFVFYTTREISSIVLDNSTNSITLRVFAAFGSSYFVKKEVL